MNKKSSLTLKNKRGASTTLTVVLTIMAIVLIGFIITAAVIYSGLKQQQYGGVGTQTNQSGMVVSTDCQNTPTFTLAVQLQNDLNGSAVDYFNTTAYFYEVSNGVPSSTYAATTSNTNGGTVSLLCGHAYDVKLLSSSSATSRIDAASGSQLGNGNNVVVNNNVAQFVAGVGSGTLSLQGEKFGLPQLKAYDNTASGWIYNNSTASATSYVTSNPVNFTSSISNSSGIAVGSGGTYDITFYVQSQSQAANFNDAGIYFLAKEATTVWNAPTVILNGNNAAPISPVSLPSNEAKAYNAYQYAYKIDPSVGLVNPKWMTIQVQSNAIASVDPTGSDAPQFALAAIGTAVSTSNANLLITGAVKDDTSQTQVHTLVTIYTSIS